jgi:hypothetical protein
VRDVTIAVSQGYFEAGDQFVQRFDQTYSAVTETAQAIAERKRQQRERELQRPLSEDEVERFFSVCGVSEGYVNALEEVRSKTVAQLERQDMVLNPILRFFRAQIKPTQLGLRLPNLDEVEFWAHKNGIDVIRFRKTSGFAKEFPEIASFFEVRANLLMRSSHQLSAAEEKAWSEMVSAWWFLNGAEHVALSDE